METIFFCLVLYIVSHTRRGGRRSPGFASSEYKGNLDENWKLPLSSERKGVEFECRKGDYLRFGTVEYCCSNLLKLAASSGPLILPAKISSALTALP
jgi:hypothetical protein